MLKFNFIGIQTVFLLVILCLLFSKCNKIDEPEIQCAHTDQLTAIAPTMVLEAASPDSILKWITILGYSSSEENIQIGIPLHIYPICNNSIEKCSTTCTTVSLVSESDFWYVPVKGKNGLYAHVGIDKINGVYRIVRAGDCIDIFEKVMSYCDSTYQAIPVIIESYEPDLIFYSIPSINDTNLTWYSPSLPLDSLGLKSTREALEFYWGTVP
jgi:hypothetical protein